MSRVARKRIEARTRLLAAATELIAEKGVEGLRLREIADRADVGFGSFYNHFAGKDELVEAVIAARVGALTDAMIADAGPLDDPAVTVAVTHRNFLRLAQTDPRQASLIVQLDRADVLLERFTVPILAPLLERGMRTGRFQGLEQVDVAISFIVGATISVMRSALDGRLDAGADVASARTLLRACGLPDAEAAEIAGRELPGARGVPQSDGA